MRDRSVKLLSRLHANVYRVTGGAIGDRLVNNDMLLLSTIGRHTGAGHTVPLLYIRDDERLVVVASFGGRPDHPHWYKNLLENPDATVHIQRTELSVRATTMTATEREIWWPKIVAAYNDYSVYQSKTDREIPLIWLEVRGDGHA